MFNKYEYRNPKFDIRISNFRVVEEWVKLQKKINMRNCHDMGQNV